MNRGWFGLFIALLVVLHPILPPIHNGMDVMENNISIFRRVRKISKSDY
jgi:hypothetical protein